MGVNKIQKVKEKRSVVRKAKEKIQAAPKELLRRGLLTGTEKLKGQLRDAAEGGRRAELHSRGTSSIQEYSADSAPVRRSTAQVTGKNGWQLMDSATRKAVDRKKKAVRPGAKTRGRAIHQRTKAAVNSATKAVKTAER